ncbi:MAG TPA: UDP-glucose 4-epimerase GalE [Chitinophagaceae bacterium]|nr:UDP-glucose 4-epimerase GalE [Chitinophagaceae bacterium]
MLKILVTGGAGYIGSHTIVDLIENGYEVISIDNYSRSNKKVIEGIHAITGVHVKNYEIDLCNYYQTSQVFEAEKNVAGIIHFAAYKSVGESVEFPIMYYENNMNSLFNILKCIQEFKIQHFVFSSSCSVYGNVKKLPVTESTPLSKPECAYAATKQMGEQVILDFIKTSASNAILLRYFNPVGAHLSGLIGEVPYGKPNNLVPIITQTAIGLHDKMYVWGNDYQTRDGSCIRDYIHVMDIASAHTLAFDYLLNQRNQSNYEIFNAGSGNGVSVLEAIQSFENISGIKLNYEMGPRRPGDVEAIYANNDLIAAQLGWRPKHNLDTMMKTAWDWEKNLSGKL